MSDTDNKKHIFVVDDEPLNSLFLTELLSEHFQITQIENGTDALDEIKKSPPDLILLDVLMPNLSGLEVCKILKNDNDLSHIPIIFLSALNQVSDRVTGYNAGGDDYITKPFSGLEVLTKIKIVLDKKQELEDQKQQSDSNMKMAMTLMSQNGETGHVLHFLKDSFLTNDIKSLCQLIIDTCKLYDLKVTIRTNTNPPTLFSHDKKIKKIDQQILDMLHMRERLIYFENRCLVNFNHISLLIKNMPIDDEDKNGRLKDHIALIMEGADARMISLENELKLTAREAGLSKMLISTQQILNEIEADFNNNAKRNGKIMSKLANKMESNFVQLGLSEEQESEVIEIIEDAMNDSSSIYQSGLNIDEKLARLTNELKIIIKN